ncbi:MAG TPA: FtsH protease activity modulator HflK [Polyangiaceae bacterium]
MAGPFDDDFDLGKMRARVKGFRPVFRRLGPVLVGLAVLGVLFGGTYEVGPGEQAVIRTFGRESGKAGPGLHFSFPLIQRRDIVNVEQVRRVEVGFRGQQRMPDEALMLTGDENIVEAQIIVQYRVSDTSKYLFRLKDPDETLRATAEVALRSMVGQTVIDELLTTGRERVQDQARAWLQRLMNDYQSGITVTELKLQTVDAPAQVREAFHDVVRAREEKERLINEARGYQADVIPRAKGEAEKLQREAEAYREQRILRANGDANRFDATLVEFQKAERVTRQRLWLEAVERVLGSIQNKVFVDEGVSKSAVSVLPLSIPAAPPAAAAGGKP